MNAPVHGLALGVTPEGPEDETYTVDQPVTWQNNMGMVFPATVIEVWDDCLEISLDVAKGAYAGMWGRTYLVSANDLRPIDIPRSTQ